MEKGLTAKQLEDFIRYVEDEDILPEEAAIKIGLKANNFRYWLKESGYRIRTKRFVEPIKAVSLSEAEAVTA